MTKWGTLSIMFLILIAGVNAQETSNNKIQEAPSHNFITKYIPDISITDLFSGGVMSVVSDDRGGFVAGDSVHLKAQSLCIADNSKVTYNDKIYGPGIWLQVKSPSGEKVFNDMIHEWDEFTYTEKGNCYEYESDWKIPNDIGDESGRYTFRIWEVKDMTEDEDDKVQFTCEEDADLPGCVAILSNMEYGEFEIENNEEEEDNPPEVNLDLPSGLMVGQTGRIYADTSDDNYVDSIRWYIDGDLVDSYGFDDGMVAPSTSIDHEFENAGEYKIRAVAMDSAGQVGADVGYMNVEAESNDAPNADIDASETDIVEGESVTLSGSSSLDPDGNIDRYEWSNGRNSETISVSITEPGSHTFELTVYDDEGASDSDEVTINVEEENEPPEADFNIPNSGKTGEKIIFDGSSSSDDNSISEYQWSVNGDTGSGEEFSHKFSEPGSYEVNLEVTDGDGLTDSTSKTIDIEMSNKEPVISGFDYPSNIGVGKEVTVSVSASDPNGDSLSYEWSDGSTGETNTYTYDEHGDKNIKVSVSDGEFEVHKEATITVTAEDSDNDGYYDYEDLCEDTNIDFISKVNSSGCYENKPPSPKFIMTAEKAEVGDEVSFDASRASDPEGRLVSREWVLGTTQKSGKLVSHEFDNPGSKTIELTVEDAAGNTKSASRTIEIVESDDNGDDSDEDSNNDNNEESFDIIKWLEDLFEVFDI